ncbi:MAG TPA: fumarylacetoacetate hydrolase family protein [Calditrichia bacterium]|nr:fumarylacetoacetate hydrolase family protein [Calditrichia bacterium]
MKLYRTAKGPLAEQEGQFYRIGQGWDDVVNDDDLHRKLKDLLRTAPPEPNGREILTRFLLPPIQGQELWASGVTYLRSKVGRQEEAAEAGGGDFYQRVYEADRPELFFKANAARVAGSGQAVRIRRDSTWDVPEPELTLMVTAGKKIVAYTIGNDMSSRSIEGENPLYLPQAKTYDGCAALGPGLLVSADPLPPETEISLVIGRNNKAVFEGRVKISQIKRRLEDLVDYLFRECSFPNGCLLMTGTGIVPEREFTLLKGDTISITIDPIGTLVNRVD